MKGKIIMAKISSKKLIERIEHLKEIEYSSYRGYDEKYEKALNDAIDIIHALNAETAEKKSKKVKYGKWEQVDDTKCRCSSCKKVFLIAVYPNGGDKNYCPRCGAKMDKEE